MRLIDADALELDADYDDGDYWAVSMAQIHNAPTITPERKRGKWMKAGTYHGEQIWQCSECHADFEIPTITDFSTFEAEPIWVYCPNCGADMRGEPND